MSHQLKHVVRMSVAVGGDFAFPEGKRFGYVRAGKRRGFVIWNCRPLRGFALLRAPLYALGAALPFQLASAVLGHHCQLRCRLLCLSYAIGT